MDGPTLFVHALILALFSHIAIQTMWQASQAAKFEVYPWKEERVDLLKYNPLASGLALGPLGFTHCCIEDIGVLRNIPGLTIISPAPFVSNPTPTPNILASIRKQKGLA